MSESEEWAKAIAESAKLATPVVDKISNVPGFIVRYVDEPLSVLVGNWVDNRKLDRWKNLLKIQDIVNAELEKRGCKSKRMIPPKLGIPLLDNALLEDDDDLREIWCKLIVNSLDPNFKEEIRSAFIDILKELTSFDAKILKYIYESTPDKNNLHKISDYNENKVSMDNIIKNINVQESDVYVSLFNLKRVQCVWNYASFSKNEATKTATYLFNRGRNGGTDYTLTPLGYALVKACIE